MIGSWHLRRRVYSAEQLRAPFADFVRRRVRGLELVEISGNVAPEKPCDAIS